VGAAYPNPFNGQTTIPFTLHRSGDVHLDIYDLRGRLVVAQHFQALPAGTQHYQLRTVELASAVYLVRIRMGAEQYVQKVTLLK